MTDETTSTETEDFIPFRGRLLVLPDRVFDLRHVALKDAEGDREGMTGIHITPDRAEATDGHCMVRLGFTPGERADDERCELREALDEARAMARMLLTGLCPVCNEPLSSVGFLRGTWRSFNTLRCSCGYTATRADLLAKLGDEGAST